MVAVYTHDSVTLIFPFFADHGLCFYHDLRFSQSWQCFSAVVSGVPSALLDGALRVQKHATRTSADDCAFGGQHIFFRL